MSRTRLWWLAARPRTLPAAIAPVLVGSGLASHDGVFRTDAALAAMIGAVAIQVAANFANDASDAARGADTSARIGPRRMVASGDVGARAMWTAVVITLAVALAAGVYLIVIAGWVVAAIGAASVLAMLTYVGGPVPYGYRGLGEAFVFVFFGLVATVGTRYVHGQSAPAAAWWLGTTMGALAAAILVANNLRDIETDAAAGKRTLAVMLGRERTRALYASLLIGSFAVLLVGAVTSVTPPLTGLAITLFFLTGPLIGAVRTRTDGPGLIGVLAGTARLQFLVAVVVAVSAAVSAQ